MMYGLFDCNIYRPYIPNIYSTYGEIGLNHDQVLAILNSNDIIQYIEDKTGEDITAIKKESMMKTQLINN